MYYRSAWTTVFKFLMDIPNAKTTDKMLSFILLLFI